MQKKPEIDNFYAASVDTEFSSELAQTNEYVDVNVPDNDESLKQETKQEETKKQDDPAQTEATKEEPIQVGAKIEEEPMQEETENLDTEEKRYSHATIDDEFTGSEILVILDKKIAE